MHQNCEDERAEYLVKITSQTNLIALDKTLSAIRNVRKTGYTEAACRISSIGERINRAVLEVKVMA